ncbi:MAG TPA: hypothetical protein PLK94_14020 [Alphaproteobacteria bacterium]|nr:hypothetical protein [Alphaproteobacteria bacterium]
MLLALVYALACRVRQQTAAPSPPLEEEQKKPETQVHSLDAYIHAARDDLTFFPYTDIIRGLRLFYPDRMHRTHPNLPLKGASKILELQVRHAIDRPELDIKKTFSGDHMLNHFEDVWQASGVGEQSLVVVDYNRPNLDFPREPKKHYTLILISDDTANGSLGDVHFFICGRCRSTSNGWEIMPYELMYRDTSNRLVHIRSHRITEEMAIKALCYCSSAIDQIYARQPLDSFHNSAIMSAHYGSALETYNRLVLREHRFRRGSSPSLPHSP